MRNTTRPSTAHAPVLEVHDLTKRYGTRRALDGLSLTVAAGEIVAVLGPNGAGKTTFLEILEGHRSRDGGTVSVLGRDPAQPTGQWRASIGIVLQEQGVQPELTVREALALYAGYYPNPRPVTDVLDLVGLADRADDRIERLSGGSRRRLDVGLGIVGDPKVLFLDEPTTGFDPDARRNMWQMVRRLRDTGTTVILTTHYLEEATALADRVIVICEGRLAAHGTVAELAEQGGPPTIRFSAPPGTPPPRLPDADLVVRPDGIYTVRTTRLAATLAALSEWGLSIGFDLPDLTITRPSLEDVYLELIT